MIQIIVLKLAQIMCPPVLLEGHLLCKQVHAELCVCVCVVIEEKGRIHLVCIMIMIMI